MPELPRAAALVRTAITTGVVTFFAGTCLPGRAEEPFPPPSTFEQAEPALASAELEEVFWRCDHAATQGLIDPGTAGLCSTATEALRKSKFNGDFRSMLAWWQRNKESEHRALQQHDGHQAIPQRQ